MKTFVLSVAAAALVISCSSQPPPKTDPKALMAGVTFDPGRCEQIGPNVSQCSGEHADPRQEQGLRQAGTTNDAELLRGTCNDGFHYVQGQGCEPND